MNKKLISFLAATAMIVTVSQESMALVGEAVSNGNVAIEQEMESDDATQEANTAEDTQVSDTNAVEVSDWNGLKTEIENANGEKTITLNGKIDKGYSDTAINIKEGQNITLVSKNENAVNITRGVHDSYNGEFVIGKGGSLLINCNLNINAKQKYGGEEGTLTNANFIKVNNGGNLTVNKEIIAHTNKNKGGDFGLILCEGKMTINDGAKISGYTINKSGGKEQAAVVIKDTGELTMKGGEVSGNYNLEDNRPYGAAIQVIDGANFIMKDGSIYNNITKDEENRMRGAGVVVIGKSSKFEMNGGDISENEGIEGAGIYASGQKVKGQDGEYIIEKVILNIDGGIISKNVKKATDSYFSGGGIYANYADVNIKNATISENGSSEFGKNQRITGGGIYVKDSTLNIENSKIFGNKADATGNEGGAGIAINNSIVNITNKAEIIGNQTGYEGTRRGGGILVTEDSNVNIVDTEISENIASPNASVATEDFGMGGGIAVLDENSNITIEDCKIENNKASGNYKLSYNPDEKKWNGRVPFGSNGGGIYCVAGTVNLKGNTIISGNEIADNGNLKIGEGIAINKPFRGDAYVELNIEGGVQIKDDIWLRTKESELDSVGESNNVINVVGELTKVDENNPIKISSQDMLIEKDTAENNTILGSKLVRYAYGKANEAENIAREAAVKKYFVPSEHMPTELNLKIGQSQIEKNILTYVEKEQTNIPPVITATDKKIFVGDKFDPLKDVTATDAEDGTITLTQNNIKENTVDTSKPGEYKVTYSVTDSVGATTEKTIKVTVKAKSTGGGGGGTIVTPPTKPTDPDRIEGNDRIETSVETSKDLYPNGTNAVVLANAERYTDVLTADPFAIQEKASALLTYKYKLPEKTLKEIERLGAKKIYISGGYDAVSKKVVDELANRGYEIFRFDGVDRYDTARKIAIKIREKGNTNAAELASGENYPDALCMTPLAVKDHAPILLTKKDSIPKYTKQALAEWDIENIKIGGLDEAISKEVEKQLKAGFEIEKNNKKDSNVYDGAKAIKRIGGEDRYETSAKLAAESYPDSKLGVYATGEDFPDALIAGNYAGRKEAPVLLVKGDSLPEPIEKYTKESKIKKATIIGGVNAVSDKVFNLIKAIINR